MKKTKLFSNLQTVHQSSKYDLWLRERLSSEPHLFKGVSVIFQETEDKSIIAQLVDNRNNRIKSYGNIVVKSKYRDMFRIPYTKGWCLVNHDRWAFSLFGLEI